MSLTIAQARIIVFLADTPEAVIYRHNAYPGPGVVVGFRGPNQAAAPNLTVKTFDALMYERNVLTRIGKDAPTWASAQTGTTARTYGLSETGKALAARARTILARAAAKEAAAEEVHA